MENEQTIILQPEYVKTFQCDGNKCNAQCCKDDWRIDIDIETYKKYQRIKNPVIRKKILSIFEPNMGHVGAMQIKRNQDGACPMVGADNLCYIHRNFGADILSRVCQVYPRMVVYIGECQLRTLSMTCPVAAEVALFSEHGMNIENIMLENESDAWKIASQCDKIVENIDAVLAANVILGSLSILQNTCYTLEQRMIILGFFLDKADELKLLPNGAEAIADLAVFYSSDEFKIQMQDIFAAWVFYPAAHGQLLTGILNFLQEKGIFSDVSMLIKQALEYEEKYSDYSRQIQGLFGTAIDRYWQQEFIFRGFPFRLEGSFLHNYFSYLLAYKVWEMCIYSYCDICDGQITKNDFLNLVTIYSKKLDHMKNFSGYLVKYTAPFEAEPIKLMQVLLRLE